MNLPPYDKFPEIISNRIVLREVREDDLENLIGILFYDSRPALNLQGAIEIQDKINLDYQNGSSVHWGIADKESEEIMGNIGFYRGFENGAGEVGLVLRPEFRGQGIMTKALELVIEFGYKNMNLSKVIAITTKQNVRAVKLLERLSFVKTADLKGDEVEYEVDHKG